MFFKIIVLKKLADFTGKYLCQSIFLIKSQALRTATLLKRDCITGFFLRILWIIQEHLFCRGSMNGWFWNTSPPFHEHLFLKNISSGFFWQFQVSSLKLYSLKETLAKLFICEFCKVFKNIFRRNTSGWLHLWILRSFPDHLFYRAPLGNCFFHTQVAGFQPQDTIKCILQVFFKHFILEQEVAIRRHSFT